MNDDTKHDHDVDDDCLQAFDHLYAYLNGELKDKNTLEMMEHHLSHCKSCFSRAQMERELNKRIKDSNVRKTPESLKNRIQDLLDDF